MTIVFLKDFEKSIAKLKDQKLALTIQLLIKSFIVAKELSSIPNIKKLKGHRNAYRLRIGNYRIGFFFLHGIVTFAAFDSRKNIYRKFP